MNGLTINVGWEYFLGIMGSLILIAWYAGGKFASIESKLKDISEKLNITSV